MGLKENFKLKLHRKLDSLNYKFRRRKLAKTILKYNKANYFVILNHHWDPAIGDACYGLSCAKEYKNRTNKKLLYIYSDRHKIIKRLINMYDFIDKKMTFPNYTEVLFLKKWPEVINYLYQKKCQFFLSYSYSYYEMGRYIDDVNFFDAIKDVYDIEKSFTNYAYPLPNKELIVDSIKQINKKVLVHFDSNSLKSNKIYNKLQDDIKNYRKEGYLVFINLMPNQTNPFNNSIGFNCSLETLYSNAHLFDLIIGIRGGIMDLLSSQAQKMIVYYDDSAFSHKLFNMQKVSDWVNGDNIQDIII